MISLEAIEREISELESRDTSYATIERLSWLYTCRDHLNSKVAHEVETVNASGSEFLCACDCRPVDAILEVFNELMDVLFAVYPKEYQAIMEKISSLQKVS